MISNLSKELTKIQGRLSKIYEDKIDGTISAQLWDEMRNKYAAEQEKINNALQAHLHANQSYYDEGIRILELANHAYELYKMNNHQERAKLLKTVLSNCSLKDGTPYPIYKNPFGMIAKGISNECWRPQRDSNPCYRRERAMS